MEYPKKAIYVVLMFLFPVLCLNGQNLVRQSTPLKLMSYNIKFDSPSFEPQWEVRKEWQIELIEKYQPDIIGTQEGLKRQIDYLQKRLPNYVVVGEGRKGGDNDEHMAIFFKRDKFRLREMGSFQLSETPEIIGSGPLVNPRMVTWMRLAFIDIPDENQSGLYPQDYRGNWEKTKEFYVFNTHFFNGSKDTLARINAAKLIMRKIKDLERFGSWEIERPIFLMGDFNCLPGSAPYKIMVTEQPNNLPAKFIDSIERGNGIDWILFKGNISLKQYEKVDFKIDGVYPSDHKPVYVEFIL